MKRTLLIALCVVLGAGMAMAQSVPGSIGLFSDTGGTNCNLADVGPPGLLSFYAVHVYGNNVASSMWMIDTPECNAMTYLSDTAVFPVTSGFSYSGISVAYGTCLSGPIHILTLNYFASGLTPPCCTFTVVASPASTYGEIEAADCNIIRMFASGGSLVVNADETCDCNIPVDEATWGGIKAMYQ
jgi:hypothetical protein